jgi:hypothetical protein
MTLSTNPRRDASATFAGYVYQVNVSVLRWLDLKPGEHLELEAGEDIDLVRKTSAAIESEKERVLEQLKQISRSITLRSTDALEALANYCQHRKANPMTSLTFRFLTTASVGKERQPWTGDGPAIMLWEELRTQAVSENDRAAKLGQLRSYLEVCPKPEYLSESVWQSFREILSGEAEEFKAIVNGFEWATESGNHEVIEQLLLEELQARDPEHSEGRAKISYRNLFGFVIRLLTQSGPKMLTQDTLNAELRATSLSLDDQLSAMQLRTWIERVDDKLEEHESRIEALESRIVERRLKTFYIPDGTVGASGLLFDFNQTLRGRRRRLEELNAFLNDPEKRIAILPGRGGIGKTKLLRDWAIGTTGWAQLWVNPHSNWADESGAEIPSSDAIVVADDAHHYSDLEKLVSYVSASTGSAKLKLIIATRPSGQSFVNETIARAADESFVSRFAALREPGPTATLEIAKEVLGTQFEHLAAALAEVSKDTPLVTVVGGRLIAREQIRPELLANDQDFRRAVFEKFAEECEGDLPTGGKPRRELLQLIAAVQPVVEQDDQFAERAAVFLSVRPDQIWKGLDDLENRGVLLRGRGGARITPDLFGDFLLESASIDNYGAATGFADAVFQSFEGSHLSNLLKNFAELDWRITQRNPDSHLLNKIWTAIYSRFRAQDAAQRAHFLREVKSITVFQPDRVEELVKIAMDETAEPGREWTFTRKRTQEDVLVELPALLGDTIFHEPVSSDAFRRLWTLSQHMSSEIHNRARKELKEAIGYQKYKNPIYNERILTLVEQLASDETAYKGDFTPLSLMDELMNREVEDTHLRGRTFSFTALPINYSAIQAIRKRALRMIDTALYSACPRVAERAAKSMASVASEFHPRFRSEPTEDERKWQDAERFTALDLIEVRIVAGGLSLQLTWRFDRLLSYIGRRDAQTNAVKERAASLRTTLSRPTMLDIFDILVTNQYEDCVLEDADVTIPQSRRDHEERALAELKSTFPDVNHRVQAVEQLTKQAVDAEIEPVSLGDILRRVCQDVAFLRALTEFILKDDKSILTSIAQVPLSEWRNVDASEYERYGSIFAQSVNLILAQTAAIAVSQGPALFSPIPEDLAILTILAKRPEGRVLGPVLFGLKRLVPVPRYSAPALDLYMNIHVGNDHLLAKEYCNFFGMYGLSADFLNTAMVERMLENLVEVDKLDRDAFGGLLARTCRVAPLAFVRFFEKRIRRRLSLGPINEHSEYEAIPSSFSWSSLAGIVEENLYREAVDAFVKLMRMFPDFDYVLGEIFWHTASLDEVTMAAMDPLLHDTDDSGPALVIRLIGRGPKGIAFTHPMFAMHVLCECQMRGAELEKYARSALFSNALHVSGMQVYAGSAPPPDTSHISPAQILSAQWVPGSVPQVFYSELANAQLTPIPSPDFSQFYDEEFEEDEPDSKTALPQREGPEEPS